MGGPAPVLARVAPSLSLTRTVRFEATHHLAEPGATPEENTARFGSLAESHRHHYAVSVTVGGVPDPMTGMLLDLTQLDALLQDTVVTPLADHDLNTAVPPFADQGRIATCEALAEWLFGRIAAELPPGSRLHRVRVAEDETLHADCTGPA